MLNLLQNKHCPVTEQGRESITILALFLYLFLIPLSSYSQPDDSYLAGSAYLIQGDFTRATESLSMAINRNNSDENLFISRGRAYLNNKETDKAISDFNEANMINPGSADLWLARAYSVEGNTAEAIKHLQSHLKSQFRIREDSIKKDPYFNSIQGTTEWFALWEKEWYTDVEKAIADADFYVRRKQFEQAVSVLDNALATNPGNADLVAARGDVFLKQGNYAAAAGDYSTAVNITRKPGNYLSRRGLAYLSSGRYREAVNDFNKALKENPADFKLYLRRAEAYAGQTNWQQAVRDMQFYLKYFENDMNAVYKCGEYYYAGGDYINALKCFNRNLKEDPDNALYYKARGMTYLNTSTQKYALSDLSMSLDLNPNDAETWMYHGLAAIKNGDKQNGCSSLRKAQQMGSAKAVGYLIDNCQ